MTTVLLNCLFVGAGGFIGSIFRYLLGLLSPTNQIGFPFVTFFINIAGAFAIAFFVTYFTSKLEIDHKLLLFLITGLCGGFTTFSTFTLESLQLIQKGDLFLAILYMVLSCVACIAFAILGQTTATSLND